LFIAVRFELDQLEGGLNKVFARWGLMVLLRASLIQLLSLCLIGLLEGAERSVVGAWSGWLPDVFLLHLHGLGFYFVLATLWADREWLLGGERRAFEVAGYSRRELMVVTVLLGGLWAVLWGGTGIILQETSSATKPQWATGAATAEASWLAGDAQELPDLFMRVEEGTVVFVQTREPGNAGRRWSEGPAGVWAGEVDVISGVSFDEKHSRRGRGISLPLGIILGQGVVIGVAGGLSLWVGSRYSWLVVVGIALVGLLAMGINSAVTRGFWSPGALVLLPVLALVTLRWSWSRALGGV
jgi:hypothetical protein